MNDKTERTWVQLRCSVLLMFPVFVVVLLIAESWPCHSCGLVRGGEDELEEARADPEKSLSRRRGEEALTGHLPSAEGLSLKSL